MIQSAKAIAVRFSEASESRNLAPAAPQRAAPSQIISAMSPEARDVVTELINRLFRDIRDCCPAWRQAWSSKQGLADAKLTWVTAFIENGISDWDNQIENGLRRLRVDPSDFVPSPGKFIGWCQPAPEDFGLPPPSEAYAEACRLSHPAARSGAKWSHPAVYQAAIEVGMDCLGYLSREASLKLFGHAYTVIVRRAMNGAPLDGGVARAIGHDSQKPEADRADEYAEQRHARVRSAQGIPSSGADARAQLLAKMNINRECIAARKVSDGQE